MAIDGLNISQRDNIQAVSGRTANIWKDFQQTIFVCNYKMALSKSIKFIKYILKYIHDIVWTIGKELQTATQKVMLKFDGS